MKAYPRILTVQDLSCLGQCSAAVALPILSACGCECCVLPTMVLSTHTGGLGEPVRHALTGQLAAIVDHWHSRGIRFDAVYVGYLGSAALAARVRLLLDGLLEPDGLLIVDPAMADHGRMYTGLDADYAAQMGELCAMADVLLPNMTEACMLAGIPYVQTPDRPMLEKLLQTLHARSRGSVVLTGVSEIAGLTGAAVFDGYSVRFASHDKLPGSFHGTGDMFASAFTGRLLRGDDVYSAAALAGRFVQAAIEETRRAPAHAYGVKFECALPMLWK